MTEETSGGTEPAPTASRRWGDRMRPWFFGLLVLAIYSCNRRGNLATDDTGPNQLLAYNFVVGHGPFLEQFKWYWDLQSAREDDVAFMNGRILSRHPVAPAIVAAPFYLPQMWLVDWAWPGWRNDRFLIAAYCGRFSKNAAGAIAALISVVLIQVLDRHGLRRVAVPTALAAALGSDLWVVGSQELWAHGPAALALILLVRLLSPGKVSRWRLAAAGLTAAALTAIRLVDVVFSVAVALWVLKARPRDFIWFLIPVIPIAAALLGYNLWYFKSLEGGQAQLEAFHPRLHGVEGVWTGNFLDGAAGTLFSPARGLFVYSPWVALALLTIPATARRIAAFPAAVWMLWALIPFGFLISKYSVWWAGFSFGPRYWTEVMPLFAILLAFALDWAWSRSLWLLIPFAVVIGWSIAIQAIGAFCYPSSWNLGPATVDLNHERLWDWRDNEVVRCLREGRQAW